MHSKLIRTREEATSKSIYTDNNSKRMRASEKNVNRNSDNRKKAHMKTLKNDAFGKVFKWNISKHAYIRKPFTVLYDQIYDFLMSAHFGGASNLDWILCEIHVQKKHKFCYFVCSLLRWEVRVCGATVVWREFMILILNWSHQYFIERQR